MARITVDDCLKRIPNRFQLTLTATYRARQLSSGASPLVEPNRDKFTVIALREISVGKIGIEVLRRNPPLAMAAPQPADTGRAGRCRPSSRAAFSSNAGDRLAGHFGVYTSPMSAVPVLDESRFGYLKPTDVARLAEAYRFSGAAHAGQTRQSGEPYISHPLAVAEILAGWHLDGQALVAALLHDVMEDTSVTKAEISDTFGKPVADLVDGVSKLDKIEFQSAEDAQAENFRKMLLAMARDVRVILIKLADRLHNMRTLAAVAPAKRRRVARETMEIYAPIANRLGLNELFHELQELAFSHTHPMRYRVLAKATRAARGNRREVVGKIEAAIKARLAENGVAAAINGREKHIYSIYRKMIEKHLSFSEVHDIYGLPRGREGHCPPATSRSACCTACTSRYPASSRTTSRSRRRTATSRCTPR